MRGGLEGWGGGGGGEVFFPGEQWFLDQVSRGFDRQKSSGGEYGRSFRRAESQVPESYSSGQLVNCYTYIVMQINTDRMLGKDSRLFHIIQRQARSSPACCSPAYLCLQHFHDALLKSFQTGNLLSQDQLRDI